MPEGHVPSWCAAHGPHGPWTVGHMATDLSRASGAPPPSSLPGPPHPPPPPPHRPEAWLCRGRPLHARGGQKARAGRLQRLRRRVAAALRAMLGSGEGGCRELDTSAKTLASFSYFERNADIPVDADINLVHTKFGDPHLVLISLPDPLPDLRLSIPGSPSPPTGFRTAYASPQSSYRRSNQSLTNHGATHAQRLACTVPQTLHFLAAAAEDLIAPPWVRDYTPSIQVHCLSRMLCLHTGTVVIAQIHRLRLVASDLPKPASLTTTATSYRGRRF